MAAMSDAQPSKLNLWVGGDVPKPDVAKPSGKALQTLTGHTHLVVSVGFSPDGQRIVSGGGRTVRIWDASE